MNSGTLLLLGALAGVAMPAAPLAANAAANTVVSSSIKPADGTSGQSLTTGSGVKTGHIQNAAVTGAKIAPGAVGAATIADGAVTAAKIAGPLPASLVSGVGLNADTLDGLHGAAFARRVPTVVVVSPEGNGDFTDPRAALASIVDASASKPYLVKILPGVYRVAAPVVGKPFVDIEGSGQGVTRLVSTTVDVMRPAGNAEVRELTLEGNAVECVARIGDTTQPTFLRRVTILGTASPNGQVIGLCAYTSGAVSLDHVTIQATANSFGGSFGLYANSSDLRLSHSTVVAAAGNAAISVYVLPPGGSSTRVQVQNSLLEARDAYTWNYTMAVVSQARSDVAVRSSAIVAAGANADNRALQSGPSDLLITGSELVGSTAALHVHTGTVAGAANSMLAGPLLKDDAVTAPSTYRCIGVFDASLQPVICP